MRICKHFLILMRVEAVTGTVAGQLLVNRRQYASRMVLRWLSGILFSHSKPLISLEAPLVDVICLPRLCSVYRIPTREGNGL